MILFLDFDGVLHPFPTPEDSSQLFVNRDRLESVLRDYPNVNVVISSTWRESLSLSALAALFSSDIQSRIVDVLPVIEIHSLADMEAIRFREIHQYLNGSSDNWVALDDDLDLFPSGCANLIQCVAGFGDAEAKKLRSFLSAEG
ncbi:HAD domain-containing protein [Oxalicibacterium solurbis]|uniref:Uncharacterized protein n=1 Tax=Oxalicibacterium solurbis TaxID=69280 RepID=A0A8J3F7Q6_9BURK|nr:HAD domain-containing protein [Oxalicibacterium solurbis]GGI55636.1 hypothetical protein GCM10011430_28100 [Oxalicibacterium solurbis]